jgi:biopolymer transport protein ExbB
MTALGLAVAVPAVMAYNWLMRRNKSIIEELARFSNDLHGYMMSGGTVRPAAASRTPAAATAGGGSRPAGSTASGTGATNPGGPTPSGTTASGSAIGTTNPGPKKV